MGTRDVFASLADFGACVYSVSIVCGDDALDGECYDDCERPGTGRA